MPVPASVHYSNTLKRAHARYQRALELRRQAAFAAACPFQPISETLSCQSHRTTTNLWIATSTNNFGALVSHSGGKSLAKYSCCVRLAVTPNIEFYCWARAITACELERARFVTSR